MQILINYTLSFEDFREASHTHRTPVRSSRSWRRRSAVVLTILLVCLFLLISTIRHDPAARPGAKPQYTFDSTIPLLLIPHLVLGAWCYRRLRCSTPPMHNQLPKLIVLIWIAGMLLSVGYGYVAGPPPPAPPPPTEPPSPLPGFLLLGSWSLLLLSIGFVYRLAMRRFPEMEWNGMPHLHRPQQAMITDATMIVESADIKTIYQWHAFLKFRETPRLFLLYTWESGFEMLPKSAFSPAALMDFTEFLRRTVPSPEGDAAPVASQGSLPPPPVIAHMQPLESREFI